MATTERDAEPSPQRAVIPLPQIVFRPTLDNWDADEQLRHLGRVLAVEELEVARPEILRIDGAHPRGMAGKHRHRAPERAKKHRRDGARIEPTVRAPSVRWSRGLLPLLTWFCTLLGTMATTCGGVLLGWSAWAERAELGRIGVPIELGGLAVLAVGMLLQLDQTWQERRTAARLHSRRVSPSCQ
jgi:hypothetical protein